MVIPGKGYGGYVKLNEILKKCQQQEPYETRKVLFQCKDGTIFANGKVLQGLRIYEKEKLVVIKGTHYTSWENATQIRSRWRVEPSLDDPYVYLSEPGKMALWSEETIKKELGTSFADTEVQLQVIVPIDLVWIKATRNVAHYAIAGILSSEIKEMRIKRR